MVCTSSPLLPTSLPQTHSSPRHSLSLVPRPYKGCRRHGLLGWPNIRPRRPAPRRFVSSSFPVSNPRSHPNSYLSGVLADNSKSRFGRRRPYMVIGCVICTSAMLLLGFTRPFASIFTTSGSAAVSDPLGPLSVRPRLMSSSCVPTA